MKEKTLVLLKPDAVQRGLIGEIITRFEKVGLKIVASKLISASEELADEHYQFDDSWFESVGSKFRESLSEKGISREESDIELGKEFKKFLTSYLSMSPVFAMVLEGHGVIKLVRKLVGPTNPADAPPGTIRGDYTIDSYKLSGFSNRSLQNLIHASENKVDAEREINLWFEESDILEWKRVDEDLIYRGL